MPPTLSPQNINPTAWYYEDKKSLRFVVECREADKPFHRTIQFDVPIHMLRISLARISKKKKLLKKRTRPGAGERRAI